jgi:hypothetical protein
MSDKQLNLPYQRLAIITMNLCFPCSAGVENPKIEVRFQNLSIDAEAYVGKRGIPTVANFFTNKMEVPKSVVYI